jgi:hypothetical protein
LLHLLEFRSSDMTLESWLSLGVLEVASLYGLWLMHLMSNSCSSHTRSRAQYACPRRVVAVKENPLHFQRQTIKAVQNQSHEIPRVSCAMPSSCATFLITYNSSLLSWPVTLATKRRKMLVLLVSSSSLAGARPPFLMIPSRRASSLAAKPSLLLSLSKTRM